MIISIESQKLKLIEQLMQVKEEATLQRIQDLLRQERLKAYKEGLKQPITTEELEEKLKRSEKSIEEGRYYKTESAREYFKNKKNKKRKQ